MLILESSSNEDNIFEEEYLDDYLQDSTLTEIDTSDDEGSVEILYLQYIDETHNTGTTKENISSKKLITEIPKESKGDR